MNLVIESTVCINISRNDFWKEEFNLSKQFMISSFLGIGGLPTSPPHSKFQVCWKLIWKDDNFMVSQSRFVIFKKSIIGIVKEFKFFRTQDEPRILPLLFTWGTWHHKSLTIYDVDNLSNLAMNLISWKCTMFCCLTYVRTVVNWILAGLQ